MNQDFEVEIHELLKNGRKIEAIKRYRELTGTGLSKAKEAVEALELAPGAQGVLKKQDCNDADLANYVLDLLRKGKKLEAIKIYRQKTGISLREAVRAVEHIGELNGIKAPERLGCLGTVLILLSLTTLFFGISSASI